MKQPAGTVSLALYFQDWVWDLSASELEELYQQLSVCIDANWKELSGVLMDQADETLALAVQKQFFRAAAFTELFQRRYGQHLVAWFRRWGTEANAAFDLAQEVFLKFHRNGLAGYDPSKSFCCYLRVTARRLWISKEVRRRRLLLGEHLEKKEMLFTPTDDPQSREEEALANARLRKALAELPADLRAVLELHFYEERSAEEIGQCLGLSVKQVYGRMHRARRRLAERLGIELPPSNRGRKSKPRPENLGCPSQPTHPAPGGGDHHAE